MKVLIYNSNSKEILFDENSSKLSKLINNWVGINYITNSLFKLQEWKKDSNFLFTYTCTLLSKDIDTKNEKILKLLSVTLGITHIVLMITLISDLIYSHFNSSAKEYKQTENAVVDLWLEEMKACTDPSIYSNNLFKILLEDYLRNCEVINREDLLKFSSIVKNYIEKIEN